MGPHVAVLTETPRATNIARCRPDRLPRTFPDALMKAAETDIPRKTSQRVAMFVRLCQAREMMREISDRRLRINEVARVAGLSPYHFIRVFRAVFGDTPYQVALAARLDRARELLRDGDLSVTDICADVGFASLGTFSHQFALRVGLSPTQYRRQVRSTTPLPASEPLSPHPGCMTLMCGLPEVTDRNF